MTPNFKNAVRFVAIATFCVAAVFVDAARSAEPQKDTLEQVLAAAMEKNPEIVTAKAKVAMAEAELNAARLNVAKEIASCWNARELQRDVLQTNKGENEKKPGTVSALVLQENLAKLRQLDTGLSYLAGGSEMPGVASKEVSPQAVAPLASQPSIAIQYPKGTLAQRYTGKFFLESTDVASNEPLEKTLENLAKAHKFGFYLDKRILAENGIDPEASVSLSLKGVPLIAALEAIEDQFPDLQFVLRDYGILLTLKKHATAHGYYSVQAYANEQGLQ